MTHDDNLEQATRALVELSAETYAQDVLRAFGAPHPAADTAFRELVGLQVATAWHRLFTVMELLEFYRARAELEPAEFDILSKLAAVGDASAAGQRARTAYSLTLAMAPRLAEAHFGMARLHQAQGRLAEAVAGMDAALQHPVHPNASPHAYLHPNAHWERARMLTLLGRQQEALASFRAALQGLQNFGVHDPEAGRLLRRTGHLEEALALYRQGMGYTHRYFPEFMPPGLHPAPAARPPSIDLVYQTAGGDPVVFWEGRYRRLSPQAIAMASDGGVTIHDPVSAREAPSAPSIATLESHRATSAPGSSAPASGRGVPIDVITIVWGDEHAALFLELTLPNLLSAGNLPAIARRHDVTYRIFTTPDTVRQITGASIYARLAATCRVEFVTPLGARRPEAIWHLHWFHRSSAEAKVKGSTVLFVPPDTMWTDGALRRIARLIEGGKSAVACPFVQVTSETIVPDVRRRLLDRDTGVITYPGRDAWDLVRRHMHPLQIAGMPGAPHARPAFELHWPVGREGMISRYALREVVAFDPRRCPITFFLYADGDENLDAVHFETDGSEMLMLSVDPFHKYLQNYIVDHSCDGLDLARTTRHPLNDTRQTRAFARSSVVIGRREAGSSRWRREETRARVAERQVRVGRAAMLVSGLLRARGAGLMADLLSVGVAETGLVRRWRSEPPLDVIAPVDTAFDATLHAATLGLCGVGRERALEAFLLDHVVPGALEARRPARSLGGAPLHAIAEGDRLRIRTTIGLGDAATGQAVALDLPCRSAYRWKPMQHGNGLGDLWCERHDRPLGDCERQGLGADVTWASTTVLDGPIEIEGVRVFLVDSPLARPAGRRGA